VTGSDARFPSKVRQIDVIGFCYVLICNQEVAGSIPVRSTLNNRFIGCARLNARGLKFSLAGPGSRERDPGRSVNRQVVEADDCAAIALDRSVIERALRTVDKLGYVDVGCREIRHRRIADAQTHLASDALVD
jgi:hypothetical protein